MRIESLTASLCFTSRCKKYTVTIMDYYIACCIFSSIPQCRDIYIVFEEQVALYKALNGTNRWRNWRQKLLTCFQSWEAKFPATSRSNRRISTELAAAPRPEELHVPVGCIYFTIQDNSHPCKQCMFSVFLSQWCSLLTIFIVFAESAPWRRRRELEPGNK